MNLSSVLIDKLDTFSVEMGLFILLLGWHFIRPLAKLFYGKKINFYLNPITYAIRANPTAIESGIQMSGWGATTYLWSNGQSDPTVRCILPALTSQSKKELPIFQDISLDS